MRTPAISDWVTWNDDSKFCVTLDMITDHPKTPPATRSALLEAEKRLLAMWAVIQDVDSLLACMKRGDITLVGSIDALDGILRKGGAK